MTIENIIIDNQYLQSNDKEILFGEELVYLTKTTDLPQLLVELGIYKSKSEARKANRIGNIAEGWTHNFKASKKNYIYIWNPTIKNVDLVETIV